MKEAVDHSGLLRRDFKNEELGEMVPVQVETVQVPISNGEYEVK